MFNIPAACNFYSIIYVNMCDNFCRKIGSTIWQECRITRGAKFLEKKKESLFFSSLPPVACIVMASWGTALVGGSEGVEGMVWIWLPIGSCLPSSTGVWGTTPSSGPRGSNAAAWSQRVKGREMRWTGLHAFCNKISWSLHVLGLRLVCEP